MKESIKGILVLFLATLFLCACGKAQEAEDNVTPSWEKIDGQNTPSSVNDGNITENIAVQEGSGEIVKDTESSAVDTADKTAGKTDIQSFTYADLAGMEFYFSSGAGGWATYFTLNEDGSFSGNYHDSDMGDMTESYPNGTLYYCDFNGCFGSLVQIDEHTYKTVLDNIKYANTPETEEIKDGIRYIYSTAYGLDNPAAFYFYLPGKSLEDLPGPFISWVPMASDTAENSKLTIYGLYNENMEYGFGGYPAFEENSEDAEHNIIEESETSFDVSQLEDKLKNIQERSEILKNKLDHEDMSQMEMNQISGDLYTLWDDFLNEVWKNIQNKLPQAKMQELTNEQLEWIRVKEEKIAAEGKQYEGGSIRPLVENRLAAQLTEDRVYKLLEYLK